jgi:hypothetical protein
VREERDRYLRKERFIIDLLYLLRGKKGGFGYYFSVFWLWGVGFGFSLGWL